MVDKIEILTNPPAKYSPEGKAGIINIILKKSTKQGINLGLNTGYIIGKKSKYVNGIDMNLGYKKFNLFANAGYNDYNFQNSGYLKRRNPDSQLDYLLSIGNINRYVKVGTDYFINSQNTLSVYTQQSGNNLRVDNESIDSNNLMKSIINQSQKDNSKYQEYDLFYKSKFDKSDHELEFQANFNKNNQDRFRNSSISLKERNHIEEKNIRANLDYSNPLSDKTMFTAGAELRLNRYKDNYESAQANVYKFERDIYSLYAEYKKQWERIGLKAGIRGELTDTKATSDFTNSVQVNTTDVQIYPTLHTSYKLGKEKKMELSFNYSRRIDRPWAGILSPVPQFVVGTIIISGNDKLKPEFTNSFQVGTSANIGKLNVEAGIFYRDIKDAISQRFVEHPSYIEIINENTKANAQYGGEFDLNFSAYKWWKNNSSLEYYWGEVSGLKQEQWTKRNIDKYIIKTTNNFVLNPSLSIQLLAQYYSKSKDLYNSYNEQWKVDISLRKMLMNNQLSISIRLADVFNTNHSKYQMINPSNLKGRSDWESRNISFSVRYNLSSGKVNRINKKVFDENTKKGGGIM
ncbi:outer membrane beta-barrel family protein [Apibacter sp. HY039]|uniref:outer membrane beta-barrel family protein n=1 Tax=Apibacter sp. HY039 TaxID=2501476 RepID=UPI000FEBB9A7|nr:outer membrane beta-barrel family protein [Apibacter sp. HY039]